MAEPSVWVIEELDSWGRWKPYHDSLHYHEGYFSKADAERHLYNRCLNGHPNYRVSKYRRVAKESSK